MFAFQLWREFKLSLAEIYALFPQAWFEHISQNIAVISGVNAQEILKNASKLWGTIKIIELNPDYKGKPAFILLQDAQKKWGKFSYGFSVFWENSTKAFLLETKKNLKQEGISVRFINKNFSNVSSAQILWEKLVQSGSDYNLIVAGNIEYFWKTIWVQDIEAYSARDYGKERDMQVGMLPPKLAQIMINLSKGANIYDPFCWLWTVLIESILAWNTQVYGSDISKENVEKTKQNINFARKNFTNSVKTAEALVLDAKGISSSPFLKKSDAIVTEWYLGQIFQKYSITEKKLELEKRELLEIYTKFFEWLKRANFKGSIVICFPFWEIRGKYFYFSEIYDIITKYCLVQKLLPFHDEFKYTRSWSLLYKREKQIVGREIFKLKMKINEWNS